MKNNWQAIMELSKEMLAHAELGEWEQVAELEQQRQLAYRDLRDYAGDAEAWLAREEDIRLLYEQERIMLDLAMDEKATVVAEIQRLHLAKRADHIYQNR
jgi:hypothetical protein